MGLKRVGPLPSSLNQAYSLKDQVRPSVTCSPGACLKGTQEASLGGGSECRWEAVQGHPQQAQAGPAFCQCRPPPAPGSPGVSEYFSSGYETCADRASPAGSSRKLASKDKGVEPHSWERRGLLRCHPHAAVERGTCHGATDTLYPGLEAP